MKFILFLFMLITLQIQANKQNEPFKQLLVNCPSGHKSYIFTRNDIYYSSSNKKFLFLHKAAMDSCKKEKRKIRTKKTAIICTKKRDIYRLLRGKIDPSSYSHHYDSCIKLTHSIPLKIIQHFPFNFQVSYYKVQYKNKIFFISSYEIYSNKAHHSVRKHVSNKIKKHHKKRSNVKRHRKIKKHHKKRTIVKRDKYRAKTKIHKKHIVKKSNNYAYSTNKHTQITKKEVPTASIKKIFQDIAVVPSDESTIETSYNNPVKETEKKYTYRCVAVYGVNRITVDDSHSMSDASDALWKRCQTLKADDEICRIKDCYRLLK